MSQTSPFHSIPFLHQKNCCHKKVTFPQLLKRLKSLKVCYFFFTSYILIKRLPQRSFTTHKIRFCTLSVFFRYFTLFSSNSAKHYQQFYLGARTIIFCPLFNDYFIVCKPSRRRNIFSKNVRLSLKGKYFMFVNNSKNLCTASHKC